MVTHKLFQKKGLSDYHKLRFSRQRTRKIKRLPYKSELKILPILFFLRQNLEEGVHEQLVYFDCVWSVLL